jgi:anti-anti-sigma factor
MATRPLEFSRSFTITTHSSPTGITVKCYGQLTGEGVTILEDEVRSLIPTAKFIEIDLSALTHIDASGASMLADMYVSAKSDGCDLKCKCEDGLVRKKLQVTRLLSVFQGYGQYL